MVEKKKRPDMTFGQTERMETGSCGTLYVTINKDSKEDPIETFITLGKTGGCSKAQNEALARMISLCLQLGGSLEQVKEELMGIRCESPINFPRDARCLSCADGVAVLIGRYLDGNGALPQRMRGHDCEQDVPKVWEEMGPDQQLSL